MNEIVIRWFGRLPRLSGVIAYGLRSNDRETFSRTWDAQFAETALNALWLRLSEIARTTVPAGEAAETLRWSFHEHVATGVPRPDGSIFFILRPKDLRADEAGLERLANEFRGLRG